MKQLLEFVELRQSCYGTLNTDVSQTLLLTACWDQFVAALVVEDTAYSLKQLHLLKLEVLRNECILCVS